MASSAISDKFVTKERHNFPSPLDQENLAP